MNSTEFLYSKRPDDQTFLRDEVTELMTAFAKAEQETEQLGRYELAVKFWMEYRMDRKLPMFNELPVDMQLYAQYIVGNLMANPAAQPTPGWISASIIPEDGVYEVVVSHAGKEEYIDGASYNSDQEPEWTLSSDPYDVMMDLQVTRYRNFGPLPSPPEPTPTKKENA